ncbi:Glycosyltransferase involved in cell wall bisynthesis [Nonomuraea solani]|uniref:Glycosyltransferase involved in cell wall bisynthesis n=1 Tax=Nonomuraea solani TaxID=1144553 RepID=A0A1H6EYX3_9ACTN|nr:Glycosyltransferase involved in cell wall bisynthesis [Nonomuraea solani]
MRILQISSCWARTPPDGFGPAEEVTYDLSVELAAAGHDVTVFATGDSAVGLPLAFHFPTPPAYSPTNPRTHAEAAIEYANSHKFDIVHNNESKYGALLAHTIRWPTVTRANWLFDADFTEQFHRLGERVMRATKFVAISHRMRTLLPELSFVGTVHNGIDVEGFPYGADKQDYVLFLGRIIPEKGVDLAIEAARIARVPLVIAGQLLDRHQEFFERKVAPALGDDVVWYGPASRSQAKQLLRHARALLMPYRWEEPFGKVLVEAQACGTPVVSVPSGAVPEVVANGVTGWLRATPEEMAVALRQVGRLSSLACREWAQTRFSRARMAADYARLYAELLADDA